MAAFEDHFNDNSIHANWTESHQAGGSASEPVGTLIHINSGNADVGASPSWVYQAMADEDFDVFARMTSLGTSDNIQEVAGLRVQFVSGAWLYMGIYGSPANNYRAAYGGDGTGSGSGGATATRYIRLTRVGDTVTCYTSPEVISWTQRYQKAFSAQTTCNLGMFANHFGAGSQFEARIDWFEETSGATFSTTSSTTSSSSSTTTHTGWTTHSTTSSTSSSSTTATTHSTTSSSTSSSTTTTQWYDFGMQIFGDGNVAQVDGLYQNYAYYEHGSISTVANGLATINLTNTNYDVFVAIRPSTSGAACSWGPVKAGATTTGWRVYADSVFTLNWCAFIETEALSLTDVYGAVIYNAAGDMIWNSQYEYCRLTSVYRNSVSIGMSCDGTSCTCSGNTNVVDADNNYFFHPQLSYGSSYHGGTAAPPGTWHRSVYVVGMKKGTSTRIDFGAVRIYNDTSNPCPGSAICDGSGSSVSVGNDHIVEIIDPT